MVAEGKKTLTKIICRHFREFLKIFNFTKLAKYSNHCKGVNFFIKLHAAGLQTLLISTPSHTHFMPFYPAF